MQASKIKEHLPSFVLLPGGVFASDKARLRSFGRALDAIHRDAKARVGSADHAYIRRVDRVSRGCEAAGRGLLWAGPGPLSFAAGVGLLWIHKQLEATEIGHTVLHGAFNRIEGAQRYRSKGFDWKIPIDERSWMRGHNGRHHGLTNVVESDPDIDFGHARLTDRTPHRFKHYFQLPMTLLTSPLFSLAMNSHFTGVLDMHARSPDRPPHFEADRGPASRARARHRFMRKVVPYYRKEFVVFPLLAGPRFARVLLGNALTEGARDVYTAATIYCGHLGEDVSSFPAGTVPRSRGERYEMQVKAANNFSVPWAVSVLCGALDLQIEHHLFPTLPTNRLREIAPDVKQACEDHGVDYRSVSWPRTLWRAAKQLVHLSFPTARDRGRTAARLAFA